MKGKCDAFSAQKQRKKRCLVNLKFKLHEHRFG